MTLTPTHTVKATMSMSLSAAHSEKGIMKAYIPIPPEIPGQHVLDCTLVCDNHPEIKAHKFYDLSPLHRPMMGITVPLAAGELAGSCNFTAMYTVALASMAPPGATNVKPVLDDNLRKIYLSQETHMDFLDPGFQAWAKKNDYLKHGSESDLDFAYRVFRSLVESGQYSLDESLGYDNDKPSQLYQLNPLKTNCLGYSILFVGLMRLNGETAEVTSGRWATIPNLNPDGSHDPGAHAIIRVFDPQKYGWYYVDIASAMTGYRRNPDSCFDRTRGNFVVFHDGSDIIIPNGPSLPFMDQISWRWEGMADPISRKDDWNVEILK